MSAPDLDLSQLRGRNLKAMTLPGPVTLYRGGVLPSVTIAYETWGQLNKQQDNGILLFTGLSPGAHAASAPADPSPGWWEYMVGPGKPLDTQRYYIICVNSLGGCFGSTGPSSINPLTGRAYGISFPAISMEDIASTAHGVVTALGVRRLSVVGASLGGMAALAYAILYGEQVQGLVSISAAAAANGFAIAMRSLQRELVTSDPEWQGGQYAADAGPALGMLLARKLGLLSYRATSDWDRRFGRQTLNDPPPPPVGGFGLEFQVQSYLDYNARKFVGQFDANSYLYLSRAMDLFNVADHGGTQAAGLARIGARRSLIMGVDSDILFPLEQQRDLALQLGRAGKATRFVAVNSQHGHDAFLVDEGQFVPAMTDFFAAAERQ